MARAKFVEVFNSPTDVLATESILSSSSADSVVENAQEPIIYHPVDSFSFGWLDGISISQDTTKPDSFFVLFRQPNADPWSTHAPTLAFYRLEENSTADVEEDLISHSDTDGSTSHLFFGAFLASVPLSASASPTSTSSSTSPKLVLGHHRTAIWLSPRPRESDSTGLVQMDLNRQEDWPSQARGTRFWRNFLGDDLVWASFEGSKIDVFKRHVFNSRGEVWTAIGYDEEMGRVALGRGDGCITFLRL